MPPSGTEFSGQVTYIVDGDGLCVGREQGSIEVRLADCYAVELNEPGGEATKAALARIAMGKDVTCVTGKNSYDHTVAACKLGGQSLGDLIRAAGVPEGGRGRQK